MKRNRFISSLLPAAFILNPAQLLANRQSEKDEALSIKPAYLKTGDIIGITCPAGFITSDDIQPAVLKITRYCTVTTTLLPVPVFFVPLLKVDSTLLGVKV